MASQLLSHLWARVCRATTAEFQPKVTTTVNSYSDVLVFEDSTTLLSVQRCKLFISFDNGMNWEKSDEIPVDIERVEIDEHYRDSRAVASTLDYELYLTEDRGKHWRKLNLPKLECEAYELDTHPFEKDYLLARCEICFDSDDEENNDDDDNYCKPYSYVSNDGGENFRKIESPNSKYLGVRCEFACKSRDSIFFSNKDLVYCLDGGKRNSFTKFRPRGDVFYTDDFGKSVNFIDQFKDHMVSGIKVLDSHVLVFTLEDKFNRSSAVSVWVSDDGLTFNKASLPTFLRRSSMVHIIEDELGRIIIPTASFAMKEEQESQIFISDSSGLQFRLLDIGAEDTLVSSSITTSKILKGTMLTHSTFKHPGRRGYRPHNKISFDYGDTWSNLRVIRSPGQRKNLFPCDVDDVENCSLDVKNCSFGREDCSFDVINCCLDPYSHSDFDIECSGTAGILMTLGAVCKDAARDDKTMTFISRDGGRSWEVAFEYPCYYAFGNGGNIIVAMAISPKYNGRPGEFYYSLDQGKTWKEYQLEVPIRPWEIISTNSGDSGHSFIIRGNSLVESLLYTVDFTGAFNGQGCGSKDFES